MLEEILFIGIFENVLGRGYTCICKHGKQINEPFVPCVLGSNRASWTSYPFKCASIRYKYFAILLRHILLSVLNILIAIVNEDIHVHLD